MPIVLISVLLLLIACFRRQGRNSDAQPDTDRSGISNEGDIEDLLLQSPLEIGQNSIIGLVRELPNSGKVELRTHRSSAEFTHLASRATTVTIFGSSRVSSPCMDDIPRPGNIISASAYQSIFDISPATPSPSSGNIPGKAIDLNRPLPPTPVSESPTLSLATIQSTQSPSLYRWLEGFFPNRLVSSQFLNDLGVPNQRLSEFARSDAEILGDRIQPPKPVSRWIRKPH